VLLESGFADEINDNWDTVSELWSLTSAVRDAAAASVEPVSSLGPGNATSNCDTTAPHDSPSSEPTVAVAAVAMAVAVADVSSSTDVTAFTLDWR